MSTFVDGYNAFAKNAGANLGMVRGGGYVGNVENAITELSDNMGKFAGYGTRVAQLKGNIAEYWHSGTFNIAAAVRDSKDRTIVPASNALASPDITGSWEYDASLKYTKNSAKDQAKTLYERYRQYLAQPRKSEPKTYEEYVAGIQNNGEHTPMYLGQARLVPSDQLDVATTWLKRKIATEQFTRPEQAARYEETLRLIDDRVRNNKGVESIPLTDADARKIALAAKEGGFEPSDWGLKTEEVILWENIMDQAFKAGLSAAIISVVLEVAPVLISAISNMLQSGELDAEDFKRVGFAALKGASLGFVRGHVAAAVQIACTAGKLGSALKAADPTMIGAAVALTMNTLQNATLMAFGQMTNKEFVNQCIQDLFTTSCSLALGSVLQALLPQLPVLGFMLGSFIGSAIGSFIYKTAYSCVISFCVNSGCTFFGLVEQDYTLPEDVLNEIGIQVFEYERFAPKKITHKGFEPKRLEARVFTAKSIDIVFLRRGVIGVNRVGYL